MKKHKFVRELKIARGRKGRQMKSVRKGSHTPGAAHTVGSRRHPA